MSDCFELHLVVPGSLARRTGGTIYDARMTGRLRQLGWRVVVYNLAGRFPDAAAAARESLGGALSEAPAGARVMIDGLAMGALPDVVRAHGDRLRILALVHHPLADETGLTAKEQERFAALERAALDACDGIVVTSEFTAARLRALGVAAEKVRAVLPGTEPARLAAGPGGEQAPRLLSVGSVIPRKGYDVLVDALARLRHLPWSCVCVGSLSRDPDYAAALVDQVADRGLDKRIELVGECDEDALDAYYDSSSLFVLASHYEGFGMVLREAVARGLPVVSTTGGAIPEAVPSEAAVLVCPGDAKALADALERLLAGSEGAERRNDLAVGARRAAARLPGWDQAGGAFAEALLELTPEGSAASRHLPPGDRADRFAADWLALREPVDHRSRAHELAARLQATWQQRRWSRIVDLGSGTGSNLRYLSPRLALPQEWTLVDHDPGLLARAVCPDPDAQVTRVRGDLAEQGLAAAETAHLVTGSALLDLVSEQWLRRLVDVCRSAAAAAYFPLSYDGEFRFVAAGRASGDELDPDEDLVRAAVNSHQLGDKGLGPALGPGAGHTAAELFGRAGYRTWLLPSCWRLGVGDDDLARRLVDGWRQAASEERPACASRIDGWAVRCRVAIERGAFEVTVGHTDLLALPAVDTVGRE